MRRSAAPSQMAKRTKVTTITTTRAKKKTPIYTAVKGKFGAQAFPKQLNNTVRYVDWLAVPLTGGLGYWQMSCNGLYDPNITGTGSQPAYFDQLKAIYNHYTVLRSKAKFTCISPVNTTTLITLYIDDDASINTSPYKSSMLETAHSLMANTTVSGPIVLYNTWDAVKYFGPNPQANDNLQGTSSSNPTEQSYYTLVLGDVAATTGQNVSVLVEIEYYVVWDELVNIPDS